MQNRGDIMAVTGDRDNEESDEEEETVEDENLEPWPNSARFMGHELE